MKGYISPRFCAIATLEVYLEPSSKLKHTGQFNPPISNMQQLSMAGEVNCIIATCENRMLALYSMSAI